MCPSEDGKWVWVARESAGTRLEVMAKQSIGLWAAGSSWTQGSLEVSKQNCLT